jgi:thiamine-phosphate pyrophosphorylase
MGLPAKPPVAERPAPRLYLLTPPIAEPAAVRAALAAALGAADVAAVLLRLAAADERTVVNRIKALAPTIQDTGAALLLDGHAELAARAEADGAHLASLANFEAAVSALKPERIAGCGGLASRHDAMVAAEVGADYVMFGEPEGNESRPSFDAIIERVSWWAEVFEIPCVGFAATLDEIAPLAAAGADFIAVADCIFNDVRGPRAAMTEAARQLLKAEAMG